MPACFITVVTGGLHQYGCLQVMLTSAAPCKQQMQSAMQHVFCHLDGFERFLVVADGSSRRRCHVQSVSFSVLSMSPSEHASVELDQRQYLAHVDFVMAGDICAQPILGMPLAGLRHGAELQAVGLHCLLGEGPVPREGWEARNNNEVTAVNDFPAPTPGMGPTSSGQCSLTACKPAQ